MFLLILNLKQLSNKDTAQKQKTDFVKPGPRQTFLDCVFNLVYILYTKNDTLYYFL